MTAPELTSTANPRIRAAAALRDRRQRDRTGLTLVDGAREVLRAIEAGVEAVEAFVCPPLVRTDDQRAAVDAIATRGIPIRTTSEAAFSRIAFGDRAEGVVLVVRSPAARLDDLRLPPAPLVVVLEAVEKPGNLGAVLRTADGAGADALIVADGTTDIWNPNAIRASAGTAFRVPMAVAASEEALRFLEGRGIRPYAARTDAPATAWEADLTGAVAIILGSEHGGLGDIWSTSTIGSIRLPMLGAADSLNVSAAAAILLYEARRQRSAPNRPDRPDRTTETR